MTKIAIKRITTTTETAIVMALLESPELEEATAGVVGTIAEVVAVKIEKKIICQNKSNM